MSVILRAASELLELMEPSDRRHALSRLLAGYCGICGEELMADPAARDPERVDVYGYMTCWKQHDHGVKR